MTRARPGVFKLQALRVRSMRRASRASTRKALDPVQPWTTLGSPPKRSQIQRVQHPLYLSLLLVACGHTPPEASIERPAPEPRAMQEPPEASAPAEPSDGAAPTGASEEDSGASEQAPDVAKTRTLTVSLGSQDFAYAEDGAVVRTGPISSGAEGYPTPTGTFSVLSKDKDKVSSRYTNQLGMQAWMPYSLQFHGNYFLHEGWLPGYPDSHGCIRVGEKDARFLFETMEVGDAVVVKK